MRGSRRKRSRRGGGEEHEALPAVDEVLEPGAEGGGQAVRVVEEEYRPPGPRGDHLLEPVGGGPPRVEAEPCGEVQERLLDGGRRGYGGPLAPRQELGEEGAGEGREAHPGAGDDQETGALGEGREGRKNFVSSIAVRRIGSSRRERAAALGGQARVARRECVECPGLSRRDIHRGRTALQGERPEPPEALHPAAPSCQRKSHRRGHLPSGGSDGRHLTAVRRRGAT